MSKSAVGRSWEDLEKEIYTKEEITASDQRVAQICDIIKKRDSHKETMSIDYSKLTTEDILSPRL